MTDKNKKASVFSVPTWRENPYNDELDLYQALGFPEKISYQDYLQRYRRQDVAHRVIKAPTSKTWSDFPTIYDQTDNPTASQEISNRSVFEAAFDEISEKTDLFTHLYKADILGSIGRYSVLFLGYNADSLSLADPVSPGDELVYVKAFGEEHVDIEIWDYDPTSERYGKPEIYQITVASESNNGHTIQVHWTRIVHIAIDTLDEELYGIPSMEPIYNRLIGLEKICGCAPEMYWNGARGGLAIKGEESSVPLTDEDKKEASAQLDIYFSKMRRTIVMDGLELVPISPQVVSPAEHVDTQLKMISIQTQIPIRILTGSERGELASTQDERSWLKYIQERREQVAEGAMLNPLVKLLIFNGTLPEPVDNYYFQWKELLVLSEKDSADIALTLTKAYDTYYSNPTFSAAFPESRYHELIMGLDTDEISKIEEEANQMDDDAYLDKDNDEYPESADEIFNQDNNEMEEK